MTVTRSRAFVRTRSAARKIGRRPLAPARSVAKKGRGPKRAPSSARREVAPARRQYKSLRRRGRRPSTDNGSRDNCCKDARGACEKEDSPCGTQQYVLAFLFEKPRVADLLISMAAAAAKCNYLRRRRLLLPRIPQNFEVRGRQDRKGLAATLDKLPPLRDLPLGRHSPRALVRTMANIDQRLCSSLHWIFQTFGGQVVELDDVGVRSAACNAHVFLVKPSNAESLRAFDSRKNIHGSTRFGFHGSSFFNWHSILRTQLKVASGTALESCGAAYGPGIYIGNVLSQSRAYAHTSPAWSNSMFRPDVACVALCEIVSSADVSVYADFVVVRSPADVIVRCLLVLGDWSFRNGESFATALGNLVQSTRQYRELFTDGGQ
eukprot:jgi/Botrbrau1/23308/Bobra.0102s0047.1